ncbi:MAG: hypothetical protein DVB23_001690 [Verrucomicrobia bacterium]|nr:MAG: hypothetical protein DVB23_001690 [Verrucomicrobiota bacterium]
MTGDGFVAKQKRLAQEVCTCHEAEATV